MSTAADPETERAIAMEMARFDASRSLVLITCAAYALNVKNKPDYHTMNGEPKRRKRKRQP
jgi:hypothetical protein